MNYSPNIRLQALLESFEQQDVAERMLITRSEDIAALTGFISSNAIVVLNKSGSIVLVTDNRYLSAAKKRYDQSNVVVTEYHTFLKQVQASARETLLDYSHTSLQRLKQFGLTLDQCHDGSTMIRTAVSILTDVECQLLGQLSKQAAKLLSETLQMYLRTGVTERELAWEYEKLCRSQESIAGLSFAPVMAFGQNGAFPHHSPTDQVLDPEMPILCDVGIQHVSGLCTDMTRCYWYGTAPSEAWQNDYQKVYAALQAGIAKVHAGEPTKHSHQSAVDAMGEEIIHSFGHGVGFEVHTGVRLSGQSDDTFSANTSVTAEPGIYREGQYGIRLEEQLIVRPEVTEVITPPVPKSPPAIPLQQAWGESSGSVG